MSTAIDSNVLSALWDPDDTLNRQARVALDAAQKRGMLIISAAVFAELIAARDRSEAFVDSFCAETGVQVDWDFNENIWREAGRAFQAYASRRQRFAPGGPRRILADFLIGAHALHRDCALLTLDDRLYRAAFPRLTVVTF